MKTAVLVLNRNLPETTDRLCRHLEQFDPDADVYVIEAGSDDDKLSAHTTWHADWDEARKHGLRYNRGMNFGLAKLWEDGRFVDYDYFMLLTNDTEFEDKPTLAPMYAILREHPAVGILAPCNPSWGEYRLLEKRRIAYFWHIMNNAYLLSRKFIETVCNREEPDYLHFLFDGKNFRGYGTESELIAKAYMNGFAAAITRDVLAVENESHLLSHAELIKTESFSENRRLYLEEGKLWMKNKYGFTNRWMLQRYVANFYEMFFQMHPEYEAYRL